MKIAVLVKAVPDTQSTLKIDSDKRHISTDDLTLVLNPYDEFAVEEALVIKEKFGGSVTLFSLGGSDIVKTIRTALAMGADDAVHLSHPGSLDLLNRAKSLSAALKEGDFDLIFAGKQASDDDCGAIGSMIAEMLEIPHIANVIKLETNDNSITAHREIEGGIEVHTATLPALITAQKGLNEPRYASLKGIMAAKKKPIREVKLDSFESKMEVISLSYPPMRPEGKVIGSGVEVVPELIKLLKEEAKVL